MTKVKIIVFLLVCFSAVHSQNLPGYKIVKGDLSGSEGYYFINAFKTNVPAPFRNLILDKNGEIVYIRQLPQTGIDFKLHPNGLMSHSRAVIGSPQTLKFFIMDSTFFIKDSVQCLNNVFTDSHDLIILPNGNYLILGFDYRIMNLSSYYWFNGNGSPGSANAMVKCNVIQEIDPNKNLVFSWHSADHYSFSDVQQEWLFNPNNVDWTHFNSVEVDTDGNLLVSVRHFSEITKINRQTGAIMWRFGGKRNQFTFINDPYNGFHGQHDARRIANGNLTLFDNGFNTTPFQPARGLEYVLNTQNMTAELIWSYAYSQNSFSMFMGSMRRMENGNNLIGWGRLNNRNTCFTAVKPDGGLIMDIQFTDSLFSYRAFNYPSLPWQLHRPVLSCRDSAGTFFLEAPAGYASYQWSTGAVTRSISISAVDTYYVFVPYGQGGFISSERFVVNNISDPCKKVIGINPAGETIPGEFSVSQNYPNPFNPSTVLKFSVPVNSHVKLTVYNAAGQEIEQLVNSSYQPGNYEIEWIASSYPSGVYFYKIEAGEYNMTRKMVLIK
jgi:hypothetical protein